MLSTKSNLRGKTLLRSCRPTHILQSLPKVLPSDPGKNIKEKNEKTDKRDNSDKSNDIHHNIEKHMEGPVYDKSRMLLMYKLLSGKSGKVVPNAVNLLTDPNNIRVIIMTLAKTGTTSLAESFQSTFNQSLPVGYHNVLHGHSYLCIHKYLPFLKTDNIDIKDFIDYYAYKNPGKKAIVVHSYREPISRLISCFFEIHEVRPQVTDQAKLSGNIIKFLYQMLIEDNMTERYKYYSSNLDSDLFEKPFDHDKGYSFWETSKCILLHTRIDLLKRLESIVPILDPEFSSFKMVKSNERKNPAYLQIQNFIKVPLDLIEKIYKNESIYLSYYYKEEEILAMKNQWTSRIKP